MGLFDGLVDAIPYSLPYGIGQGYANAKNYQSQQELLAWQQFQQAQTWLREDNATQRRVADLKAAGLSPTLAAGSAANAGSVVSTAAPQRGASPDIAANVMAMLKMNQDIETSKTQRDLMAEQIDTQGYQRDLLKAQMGNQKSQSVKNAADALKSAADTKRITEETRKIKKDADLQEMTNTSSNPDFASNILKNWFGFSVSPVVEHLGDDFKDKLLKNKGKRAFMGETQVSPKG